MGGDRDAEIVLREAASGAGGARGGLVGDVDIRRAVRYGLLSRLSDRLIFKANVIDRLEIQYV